MNESNKEELQFEANTAKIIRSLISMGVTKSKLYKDYMEGTSDKMIDFKYNNAWFTIDIERKKNNCEIEDTFRPHYHVMRVDSPLSTQVRIQDLDNVNEAIESIYTLLNTTQ